MTMNREGQVDDHPIDGDELEGGATVSISMTSLRLVPATMQTKSARGLHARTRPRTPAKSKTKTAATTATMAALSASTIS